MWKIRFRDDYHDSPIELYAEEVVIDEQSPFVCITGIRTKYRSQTIIVPGDCNFEEFAEFDPLYICYNSLIYAGRIKEGQLHQMTKVVHEGSESRN